MRSREPTNISSVPALSIHDSRVPNAAAIQDAATTVQKESKWTPGTQRRTSPITIAWPTTAPSATASHPMAAAIWTRTGRTIMPMTPVPAVATTNGHQESKERPGSTAAVSPSASVETDQETRRRTRSPDRIGHDFTVPVHPTSRAARRASR